jgi:hypothetical protein
MIKIAAAANRITKYRRRTRYCRYLCLESSGYGQRRDRTSICLG